MLQNKKKGIDLSAITEIAKNYAMYIALAVIFIVFQMLSGGNFLTARNLTNLINQTGYIAVLAVGMTLVLIICQIDLSVGYMAGFLGACAARLMVAGLNVWLVILITILMGGILGFIQGFVIGKIGVPAFVTTLAGEFIFRGFLTLVTEATGTIPVTNEVFKALSNGFLPEVFTVFGYHGLTLVAGIIAIGVIILTNIRQRNEMKRYNFHVSSLPAFIMKIVFFSTLIGALTIVLAGYRGISWTIVIVCIVVLVYAFVLNNTKVGRYIYGMGGNAEAAKLSGVNIRNILIGTFVSMGAMAGLAGILYASRLSSATPTAGSGFELDAIASCYIAGVSTSGGVGSVVNSVVGAFVIMSLTNGLNLIGVGISYQYIIKGVIFVAAVAIDVHSRGRKALG